MTKARARFAAASATVVLSACSSFGAGAQLLPPHSDLLAAAPVTVNVSLRLRLGLSADGPGPNAATPKAESAKVVVNSAAGQVFSVMPSAPGCTKTANVTTCTFHIVAPVGSDTFEAIAYSGPKASGDPLGGAEATVPIVSGRNDLIKLTLGPVFVNGNDAGSGSLRTALTAAASGDTIVYAGSLPVTVTLSSPLLLSKNVTIAGPGASKLALSGGDAVAVMIVHAGVTAAISGLAIERGSTSAGSPPRGGAIQNAGKLRLTNVTLSDNFAAPVYDAAAQKSNGRVRRLRFDPRPRKRNGRAPRPPRAPRVTRPAATTPAQGGAIFNTGTLDVSGSIFSGNAVQKGSGAAIYNAAGATLNVASSSFSGNAAAYGGAVYNAGSATLTKTDFSKNTGYPGGGAPISGSYGYGAAIYSTGTLSVTSCTFTANVVGGAEEGSYGYGGAIAHFGGTLTISGSTFTSNRAGGGSEGSYGYGGAFYSDASTTPTLDDDAFNNNQAGGDAFGYGGAVFVAGRLDGADDTFSNNTSFGSSAAGYAYGGAAYVEGALSLAGGSFSSNTATGGSSVHTGYAYAGALDCEGTCSLSKVAFRANKAFGGPGGSAEAGAAFVDGGNSAWTGVSFTSNSAVSSGTGSYGAGGAVVAFAPLAVSGESTFTSNFVTLSGSNTDGGVGGALAIEAGPFQMSMATVTKGSAWTQGGGLWLDDTAAIATSLISSNTVASVAEPQDGGGGIYNSLGGSLTLSQSTVSGNATKGTITASGGGGVFNAGEFSATNSTITGNTASMDGGGVENDAATGVTLTNVTIYSNSAIGSGGSLKNLYDDAAMTVGNSILAGGTAASGADISSDGTITSADYNVIQTAPSSGYTEGAHDLNANPQLMALTNNGGPTPTDADGSSSPGRAYIPLGQCTSAGISVDQRGEPRGPNGDGSCDVGAYENQLDYGTSSR